VSWNSNELEQVETATELEFAARRTDGTLSGFTVMWVVRIGASLYVRSARGPDSTWYRRAIMYGRGRIRAGNVESDVVLHHLASLRLLRDLGVLQMHTMSARTTDR
jgi:hypothetical protein